MHDFPDFAARVVAWQLAAGRHDLPWQGRDAYAVWVSEIMLQQTQVETVIPYYQRFMARFPDLAALAAAPLDDVLGLWSGLGYYARARNLLKAAQLAQMTWGRFPTVFADIMALPGVGRSTAGAIAALAYGERHPILDGNVRRVLCRVFAVPGWPGEMAVQQQLWTLAEHCLPEVSEIRSYTQGLMDLGATLCMRHRPQCQSCPLLADCVAAREARQAEFPWPRPARVIPQRETGMLILRDRDQVLLERRPATGIWGGLWSLPECGVDAAPMELEAQFGVVLEALPEGERVVHTFSHFQLHITPRRFVVRTRRLQLEAPGRIWLSLHALDGAALPAPVKRLLQREIAGAVEPDMAT